jgi:hypothetical protein
VCVLYWCAHTCASDSGSVFRAALRILNPTAIRHAVSSRHSDTPFSDYEILLTPGHTRLDEKLTPPNYSDSHYRRGLGVDCESRDWSSGSLRFRKFL